MLFVQERYISNSALKVVFLIQTVQLLLVSLVSETSNVSALVI